ncbi:MAG TPA: DUF4173 domain-containing protein [Actinomycetales bacterium]|nr:DUF4173 domain-containing protein [Actinomycetales bacterium]
MSNLVVTQTGLERFWLRPGTGASTTALGGAVTAGLVAAALVPGNSPGLGLALAAAAVGAVALPGLLRRRRYVDTGGVVVAVALIGVVAVRDAPWVVLLCGLAAVAVGAVALTGARSWVAVALSGAASVLGGARSLPWAGRGAVVVTARGSRLWPLVRAVTAAAVLLIVFGMLFASADVVFAGLLPEVDLALVGVRAMTLVLGAAAALAVTYVAARRPEWGVLRMPSGRPARRVEWLVPLLALDVLVVAFVVVQVSAALGGHRHLLAAAGLTYAEYAREGFWQLVVATILVLLMIAVGVRYAPRATRRDRAATSATLAVLVVATLGVVVSAVRRMDLYVDAYGLTRLRLWVLAVEIFLGLVLVAVLVAGVRWRGGWLPRAVTAAGAVTMLCLAGLNPDALIARVNTERHAAGADIDLAYLRGLSADAVVALDALPEPLRSCALRGSGGLDDGTDGWGSWNLSRSRAEAALAARPLVTGSCPESGTMPG